MTSSYTILLLFHVQIHSTIIFISQDLVTVYFNHVKCPTRSRAFPNARVRGRLTATRHENEKQKLGQAHKHQCAMNGHFVQLKPGRLSVRVVMAANQQIEKYTDAYRAGVLVELGVVVDVEDLGLASADRPRRRVVTRGRHGARRTPLHVRQYTQYVTVNIAG